MLVGGRSLVEHRSQSKQIHRADLLLGSHGWQSIRKRRSQNGRCFSQMVTQTDCDFTCRSTLGAFEQDFHSVMFTIHVKSYLPCSSYNTNLWKFSEVSWKVLSKVHEWFSHSSLKLYQWLSPGSLISCFLKGSTHAAVQNWQFPMIFHNLSQKDFSKLPRGCLAIPPTTNKLHNNTSSLKVSQAQVLSQSQGHQKSTHCL